MRTAILYAGGLRTWEQCKLNQEAMISGDKYFFTDAKPSGEYTQFIKIPQAYYPYLPDHPYTANKNPYSSVDSSLNQWHNNFVNFSLVPNDYQVYVKSRCDIQLSGKIDFNDYDINDNTVYIPSGNDHWGGVNDQFAFGSYAVMKKYFSVYVNHQYLFAAGVQFHPEGYVTKNLEREGVGIVRLPITNTIVR